MLTIPPKKWRKYRPAEFKERKLMSSTDPVTPEMRTVLQRYKIENGRGWKAMLREAWLTGHDANHPDGAVLREIRNKLGPSWLMKVKL